MCRWIRGYLNDADKRLGVLVEHRLKGRRRQTQYGGAGGGSYQHRLKGSRVTLEERGR